ncbi:Prenylcysteine lyase-domain-containing protein, partial [Dimargaris cristalligena]
GGGASGTSAAYFIHQAFQDNPTFEVQLTLYEKSNQTGGRSQVVHPPAPFQDLLVEVGASIFVKENRHMVEFTRAAGLELVEAQRKRRETGRSRMGVWNGEGFNYLSSGWRVWDMAKFIWNYGVITPTKVSMLVNEFLNKFRPIYDEAGPFTTMQDWLSHLGLQDSASQSARTTLAAKSHLDPAYLNDIVEISTRVNYAQSLDVIHTIGMAVSMVPTTDQEYHVGEGNYRVFEYLQRESGAEIRMESSVGAVVKMTTEETGSVVYDVVTIDGRTERFDAVVVATPLNQYREAPIQFHNLEGQGVRDLPPAVDVEYRTLHVTVVLGQIRPAYFNRAPGKPGGNVLLLSSSSSTVTTVPETIFSTQAAADGPNTPFTSISAHHFLAEPQIREYLRLHQHQHPELNPEDLDYGLEFTITKIFSPAELSDVQLAEFYASRLWVDRRVFKSYPVLQPRKVDEFPPILLDTQLYYPNAFEPFISTMETSILSAKNVAGLVYKDLTKVDVEA